MSEELEPLEIPMDVLLAEVGMSISAGRPNPATRAVRPRTAEELLPQPLEHAVQELARSAAEMAVSVGRERSDDFLAILFQRILKETAAIGAQAGK